MIYLSLAWWRAIKGDVSRAARVGVALLAFSTVPSVGSGDDGRAPAFAAPVLACPEHPQVSLEEKFAQLPVDPDESSPTLGAHFILRCPADRSIWVWSERGGLRRPTAAEAEVIEEKLRAAGK
jgi:hypothetical protein